MNKQELIDELTKTRKAFFEVGFNLDLNQPNRDVAIGVYTGIGIAKNFVERLDEPQKVKVPAFVAEWYEEHKCNLSNSLWEFTVGLNDKTKKPGTRSTEFENWFLDHPQPYETIIRMQEGYEIEKEPRWIVKTSEEVWVNDITTSWCNSKVIDFCDDKRPALVFLDKKIAEAVALLVDGSVEEV